MSLKAIFSALIFSILFTACSSKLTTLSNGKKIDNQLVGVWTGSEKDQQSQGTTKYWTMTREADGTFELDFTYVEDGEKSGFIEQGKWWIEGGKFHEYHNNTQMTDIYTYKVLNEKQVKFKSVKISIDMEKTDYEFIDTRK